LPLSESAYFGEGRKTTLFARLTMKC
jgi:hypothetical protein